MRFFFYHFYHGLSWTYDLVAAIVSVGRWRDWGKTVLPHLSRGRVLELGFGPGHLQSALTSAGFQAIGIDESRQMCRQAARNLLKNGHPANLSLGYAQTLPFASGVFDSVVATFPSEYIAAPETLAEAGRVLKDDGRLVVALSAHFHGASLPDKAADWLFQITGQGQDLTDTLEPRIQAYFVASRLKVRLVREEVRQSTVLLVIGEKVQSLETLESLL